MSKSLNQVQLIGHVGHEPEIRVAASGVKVAKWSLATHKLVNGVESPVWHRLKAFDKVADVIDQYVHKGDRIYIRGELEYSTTEGDDGVTRHWTDIIVRDVILLGSKDQAMRGSARTQESPPQSEQQRSPFDADDDDLPF